MLDQYSEARQDEKQYREAYIKELTIKSLLRSFPRSFPEFNVVLKVKHPH